jgi:hypothetical protein
LVTVTEGVQYLAEQTDSFWLIDAVGSYQPQCRQDKSLVYFQLWILSVPKVEGEREYPFLNPQPGHDALLTCWYDTPEPGQTPPISQHLAYTDFPLPEMRLYCCNGVLMLPTEY